MKPTTPNVLRTLDGSFLIAKHVQDLTIAYRDDDGTHSIDGVEYELYDGAGGRIYRLEIWETHATCDCPQYRALDDCRHVEAAALAQIGEFAAAYTPSDPPMAAASAEGGAL